MLPKGTKRRLKDKHDHWYVKLEDKYFAWWEFKGEGNTDGRKRAVRLTDSSVKKEVHFELF